MKRLATRLHFDPHQAELETPAHGVARVVHKYQNVLELRRRQLETAAAGIAPRRREQQLHDTLHGYAADLDQYASELRSPVEAFRRACEEIRSTCSRLLAADTPQGRVREQLIQQHVGQLKLARAQRELAAGARNQVRELHARRDEIRAPLRRLLAQFDGYAAALDILEGVSHDMLAALDADATERGRA